MQFSSLVMFQNLYWQSRIVFCGAVRFENVCQRNEPTVVL